VRIITPSGGISSVDLQFDAGKYTGSYTWTQPGQHTVSVSLDQEAIVGSPFTVEATSAIPNVSELESMSEREVTQLLPKLSGEGAAQALQALAPDVAARALYENSPEAIVRMTACVMPGNIAEILSCMPPAMAGATIGSMSDERASEVLASMQASDATKLMTSMSSDDLTEKAEMYANALSAMKDEERVDAVRALMATPEAEKGITAIFEKLPARTVAEMAVSLKRDETSKLLSSLTLESTAAIVSKLPEELQMSVMSMLGGDSLYQMTKTLYQAYKIDKSASAQERKKMQADAEDACRRFARPLGLRDKIELGDMFRQASEEHIGGCLYALVQNKLRSVTSTADARPVAQLFDNGEIEWGDGSRSKINDDRTEILHPDGTKASLSEDGTIVDTDGQVLKLREDGIITSDGTVMGDDGAISSEPSGALHMFRAVSDLQRTASIVELLHFAPNGCAAEILIDLTLTELREVVSPMGSSDVAKLLIDLGRVSPTAAARVSSVLSHTAAASAVSIMVNPGSSGRCAEPWMGPFLEALSAQVLRNVEPPTAVGGALAEHCSPTVAATILHKMEPMDVSRILEGMSPA